MYLCVCKGWKESDVRQLACEGAITTEELTERLGLFDEDCCGTCLYRLDEFEALVGLDRPAEPAVAMSAARL
jgi:bacterioferritin-associated ferredoxin